MRNWRRAKNSVAFAKKKTRGVESDQYLREQRLGVGLAALRSNRARDLLLALAKQALELFQRCQPFY